MQLKKVSLGEFEFSLPDFVIDFRTRDKPPLHVLNVIVAQGVTFDATVLTGRGTDEECSKLLRQVAESYGGESSDVESVLPHSGVRLRGLRLVHPKMFAEHLKTVVEVYAAPVGPDLFSFSVAFSPSDGDEGMRAALRQVADVALVRRLARLEK